MAITIKVGQQDQVPEAPQEPVDKAKNDTEHLIVKMHVRKSLDGNLMIWSHEDLDILIDQKKGKIISFATDSRYDDKSYDAQNRFFKYMVKKGIIDPNSVHMGNIHGALEGKILEPEDPKVNKYDVALFVIEKFITSEKPNFLYQKQTKEEREEDLVDPDDKDTTELGKIPHQDNRPGSGGLYGNSGASQMPYEEE